MCDFFTPKTILRQFSKTQKNKDFFTPKTILRQKIFLHAKNKQNCSKQNLTR